MLLTRLSRPTSDINSESDLANEAINPEAGRPHEEIDRWIDDTAISYFMAAAVLCALAGMEWLGYLAHSPDIRLYFLSWRSCEWPPPRGASSTCGVGFNGFGWVETGKGWWSGQTPDRDPIVQVDLATCWLVDKLRESTGSASRCGEPSYFRDGLWSNGHRVGPCGCSSRKCCRDSLSRSPRQLRRRMLPSPHFTCRGM
jgi:hypothetical protein